ncbi:cell envelope integrity protein TolA [Hydrogenophaga sp.]|uniref:cell envelope integrity protein TolA n=1 Tax=Hydrogenophaga sp. TaxID=1904254 RepID=UPI00286E9AE6|nr:cell envelope integrity protein TolA [Hydrogenophaga sp.]
MTSSFALSRHAAQDHLSLAPPRQGHWLGPTALALLAHVLLVAALTWGVGWKQDAPTPVFEAELWSRLPVQAAPRAEAPPPAPPPPAPEVRPEPRPAPPPPPPSGPSEAQIATQRAQQKKEQAQRALETARQKAQAEKAATDKAAADKKRLQEQKKAADQKKVAEEQREREEATERQRQANIRRMLGQAGASGGPQATGTAQQSAGPSAGYGARVAARIKPNVVFTESIVGNPRTEVEVRTLPDGTIAGRRIVKSSGDADWDEAVLKAIDRTATLPRDTDGRVPPALIIGLRPQD